MALKESWYVLHVRSRAELSVAQQIRQKGYEPFVPLYRSRRRWADRLKELMLPLFPNYVFCRVTTSSTGRVVTTPGVIRFVGVGGIPSPIDDHEIEALQRVVSTRLPTQPWPHLPVGQRVELGAGPLRGLQGILTQAANRDRFIVSISLLQRSVSVEISGHDVLPLGPPVWRAEWAGAGSNG